MTPQVESPPEEPTFTLAGHLEELRRRLAISLGAVLVAVGISATQVERLIAWLKRPAEPLLSQFAFFSPTEPLLAYTKVVLLSGFILAMPIILSQLWAFVRPGLLPRERAYGLTFMWWGSAQFLAGVACAYYGLLPISLRVLLRIGRDSLKPVISIDQYLGFVTSIAFWCGVVFELPVVVWLLAKVGIVTAEWLRQQRPYAILVLVILAAIMTPTTDILTLLLMTVPMLGLYECSIILARAARHSRLP